MYLHPLIHSELTRQRQAELSRLPYRGDRESRSLPGKRAAATLGVLLVALIAALALTSGALAATAKKQPGTAAKQPSFRIVQDASGKITVFLGKRIVYVYYPAPPHPLISNIPDTSSDCENYQLNCTDEQNCQHWGVSCVRISNTSTDTPATNQGSTATDSSTDTSSQADKTSLQPMPEVVSDISATQAATDVDTILAGLSTDEDC
jgi:hypothetical protein